MDRELKIVSTVFLVFLIYGFVNVANSGSFAVPVFWFQLSILFVSIAVLVLNWKRPLNFMLLAYVVAQVLLCLVDGYTVNYLATKGNPELWIALSNSMAVNWLFIICYFGFMAFFSVRLLVISSKKGVFTVPLVLLLGVCVFFFLPEQALIRDVLFMAYLALNILIINRLLKPEDRFSQLMSYQFLLLFLLESLEYFV